MMACLELVSLSSRALEQAPDSEYDLVFDLSSKGLAPFSTVNCWKGRSISPLRDRIMIEWLFSHRAAGALLKEMTSQINKALRIKAASSSSENGHPAPSTILHVAIGCQNGAQHSVCFVEKLYEQYSFESPLVLADAVKIKVKKQHCEATKGEWLNSKDAVWWQHSQMSTKSLPTLKDLVLNRSWSSFPTESSSQIEAAFRQDPYATKVDVGKHLVDFERGIVFNKRSRNEFRIRSAIPRLEGKVRSSWVVQQEGGKKQFFCGAGILFYSVHPQTGEAVFLLGHMTYSAMAWCDFGGMKDHGERPKYTAARECYEETLEVLGNADHLASLLDNCAENNVFEIANKNTQYVGYYLRVPYKDYPTAFEKAIKKQSRRCEVDEIRWFPLSSLRRGIQKALLDQYDLLVEPLSKDGTIAAAQRLPLRQEFGHSLCIAEQLGVLSSIEHIAKSLHERSHPAGSSLFSLAAVEESLQAVSSTGSNSLEEESQKLKDSEPIKLTEDDTSRKDTACEDGSFTSANEKLESSDPKNETVNSKTKAVATGVAIDSGCKKFRYYGAGVGSFFT